MLHYGKNCDKCLSLAEFSYNNSYQSSVKMAPFEALYGRSCRTPLNWSQAGEREIFGPDLVLEAEEKVRVIKNNLEAAQARQKASSFMESAIGRISFVKNSNSYTAPCKKVI